MKNYLSTILDENESVLYQMSVAKIYREFVFIFNIIIQIPIYSIVVVNLTAPEVNGLNRYLICMLLLLFSLKFLWWYLSLIFTEYLISDKRIIIKKGVVTRTIKEMNLASVETVTVNQGIIDRLFKTGSIAISGRGSEKIHLADIDEPSNVRKKIENSL